jgi:hypothetical protein
MPFVAGTFSVPRLTRSVRNTSRVHTSAPQATWEESECNDHHERGLRGQRPLPPESPARLDCARRSPTGCQFTRTQDAGPVQCESTEGPPQPASGRSSAATALFSPRRERAEREPGFSRRPFRRRQISGPSLRSFPAWMKRSELHRDCTPRSEPGKSPGTVAAVIRLAARPR